MSTERTPLETIHALREAMDQIAALKAALSSKDAEIEALREAAKDVVSRWDSPKWKYDEHTGVIINRLRVAAKLDQP